MINMTLPKNIRQVHALVGLVNYYRDIWARPSNLLQPLTALMSTKVTFKQTDVEQQAFDKIKQIVARDTVLIYLYLNERFDIHTDVSSFHLGAVISQNGKPIAFYSRKLTPAQSRYTVTKKITQYSQNLEGISHNFIRSRIKNIYRP